MVFYSPDVQIRFALTGLGWANLSFNIGGSASDPIEVSYITDAFADLLRAVLHVVTFGRRIEVHFDGEPTIWRLTFHREGERSEDVLVELHQHYDEPKELLLYRARCTLDALGKAMLLCADEVRSQTGADSYEAKWNGDVGFPLRALAALKSAMAVRDGGLR